MKKRKIIATVGPSSMNKNIIKKMDDSGVDMFRINLSHTKMEDFKFIVNTLQSWTDKPICPDTEGSQLRTTIIGKKINVVTYSLKNRKADFYVEKIANKDQRSNLFIKSGDKEYKVETLLFGNHNFQNIL